MALKTERTKQLVPVDANGLVPKGSEEKSGCLWCPLLPWSGDFGKFESVYNRDAAKITAKEKDGHEVLTRCVTQPWDPVDVLFVGEAPGAHEDKKGEPFVGGSGGLLRKVANAAGLEGRYGVTNIVSCRPPRNRKPNKTEVQSCVPKLIREIQARKPKLVVVLGNTSLEYLTGQTGITMLCGSVLDSIRPELPDLKILACLHPAYVLRMDHETDKFIDAIEKAADFVEGNYKAPKGEGKYRTLTDVYEIAELFKRFADEKLPVAFDTETGSLQIFQTKFPRLLCFSFSNKEGEAFTIPYDHAESPFRDSGPNRSRVRSILRSFFLNRKIDKIAQNEKFDRNHIRSALGVEPTNVLDTMLIHFVIDEQRGTHSLKTLAYAYTGMGGYDQPLEEYKESHKEAEPKKGGSYANIPGDLLFKYAAMDADVTVRVYNGLIQEEAFKSNKKLQRIATEFYPRLSETLADMEYEGAQIDPKIVKLLDRKYTHEMAALMRQIVKDPKVKRYIRQRVHEGKSADFNPESTPQLQEVLFRHYGLKPVELTDAGFSKLTSRHAKLVQRAKDKGLREPTFEDVVRKAIKDVECEFFSTKADVLNEFERRGNPLCKSILEYRALSTLHGTFVKPLLTKLDKENRVHGTYLIHGTVTARLASRDPNLQNIPNKGDGLIKRCYTSRFGDSGVFVQGDYSQIELRIAGCYFNEPAMIRAYKNGEDLHTNTAIDVAKMGRVDWHTLESGEAKGWRVRAKRVNFGVLYGGGPQALVNTLRKDGVFITAQEAKNLISAYFKTRPGLKRGMDKLMDSVRKKGYLEAFTGHRRRVPEVFSRDEKIVSRALRQSVNFPIQCAAAQMTNMSMVLLRDELRAQGFDSRMVLTTHDSIAFDTHVDELFDLLPLVKGVMESITVRSNEVLPGLDWSWLRVPIVADLEVGFDWGTMVSVDPFDVDVDDLWIAMETKQAA